MSLPPAWKVKRELMRVVKSVRDLPRNLIWYAFATRYYEWRIARDKKVWTGQQSMGDKVVVFVLYPSSGLPDSALLTLDHIDESGYSAVVVSNLPLPGDARDRVLDRCASYIERPNFGYDFGAYRDGVLSIAADLPGLRRLVLLNDSAWYPLPGASNWLLEAEAMGHDLVGATSNYGTPRIKPEVFRDMEWTYSTTHRNFHYCSFALSFGPKILQSPKFHRFWSEFAMDNDKSRVVRRGEIGLTAWVMRNGFSHGCTCNPSELDAVLLGLSDDRLDTLAHNLIFAEHRRGLEMKRKVLAETVRDEPAWRPTMHRLALMAASVQGLSYAMADLTTKDMGFAFLKKSPLRLNPDGADCTERLISDLPGEMGIAIRKEAAAMRRGPTG